MSSKKRNALIMLIIVAVLAVAIIVSLIVLILQRTGLDSITISPEFSDTQLDINGDYKISVKTEPEGVDIAKFKYEIDSSSATFTVFDDGSAILHTSSEGAVTINVSKGKIESNSLTFEIVDKAAQEAAQRAAEEALAAEKAAAEAEAAAAEAAAAEAAAASVTKVKVIKDAINVRSSASTDSDIVGKAKKGDTFEVIEDDGSWTKVKFQDKEGFIRNDLIETVKEGEGEGNAEEEKPKEETKKEEKKEEKKQEANADNNTGNAENTQQAEAGDNTAQTNEQAEALKKQEQAAEAAAAAATVAVSSTLPPTGSGQSWSFQGTVFTPKECDHFHARFDFTGDAAEAVTHHSAGELIQLLQVDGLR